MNLRENLKLKKQVFKNTKSSEPTVKTRFHNINQTFTKYTPEELEKILQESQKELNLI